MGRETNALVCRLEEQNLDAITRFLDQHTNYASSLKKDHQNASSRLVQEHLFIIRRLAKECTNVKEVKATEIAWLEREKQEAEQENKDEIESGRRVDSTATALHGKLVDAEARVARGQKEGREVEQEREDEVETKRSAGASTYALHKRLADAETHVARLERRRGTSSGRGKTMSSESSAQNICGRTSETTRRGRVRLEQASHRGRLESRTSSCSETSFHRAATERGLIGGWSSESLLQRCMEKNHFSVC
ncbi:hypothetical protein P7C73_g3759, partial [Tremellales sp. Uapishka_1]